MIPPPSAPRRRYVIGGGTGVLIIVAWMLFQEFFEPRHPVWDALLVAMLIGVVIAAIAIMRFSIQHQDQIGEARFDTRNPEDR